MKFLLSIFLIVLWISCGRDTLFESYQSVPNEKWYYKDTLTFLYTHKDKSTHINSYIHFRHSSNFEWMNAYVAVIRISPQNDTIQKILSIPLALQNGQWTGDCTGSICTQIQQLSKNELLEEGVHTYKLVQYMRENPIKGVLALGMDIKAPEETE